VHQIARNAITDHYRRASLRREQPAGIELGEDESEPAPADGAARRDIAACLRPLLEELPSLHREALALTELGGLSRADAARRLGVSASGMKSRPRPPRPGHRLRTERRPLRLRERKRGRPLLLI
jgi:RNA polymerase sigma-70 factor (ECF subfamily)